ncbi:MAG: hypothetical protein ABEH38_03590, partial [Flavobacteriales bacterium]
MGYLLKGKRILLISPEPWDHIAVSKHHYAQKLAERDNEVFFLGPPEEGYDIQPSEHSQLWILGYPGFPKGMRFFPRRYQGQRILKEVERLEKLAGDSFDIIWSFDDSVFFEMSALPDQLLKILHIVDLDQDFQLKRAAHTTDIRVCTTPYIRDRIKALGKDAQIVGHGHSRTSSPSYQKELPGKNPVKALFAGNLRRTYLDWGLLYEAASALPKVDFVLLGPNGEVVDPRDN